MFHLSHLLKEKIVFYHQLISINKKKHLIESADESLVVTKKRIKELIERIDSVDTFVSEKKNERSKLLSDFIGKNLYSPGFNTVLSNMFENFVEIHKPCREQHIELLCRSHKPSVFFDTGISQNNPEIFNRFGTFHKLDISNYCVRDTTYWINLDIWNLLPRLFPRFEYVCKSILNVFRNSNYVSNFNCIDLDGSEFIRSLHYLVVLFFHLRKPCKLWFIRNTLRQYYRDVKVVAEEVFEIFTEIEKEFKLTIWKNT